MSVTLPKGFSASSVAAGLKSNGELDLTLIVNNGRVNSVAAVFTKNRVQAAPVKWSKKVVKSGIAKAVILNSGGANACTGGLGDEDAFRTAEEVANGLSVKPEQIAVCSTGLIGTRLQMERLLPAVRSTLRSLETTPKAGEMSAVAIMTTDSKPKIASIKKSSFTIGAIAKGAGMLAPAMATMLVVITTDALLSSAELKIALQKVSNHTFDRIDSDGCMSTNDSVLLMASGESQYTPSQEEFESALFEVCCQLSEQLVANAEGATKQIAIEVMGAHSVSDALEVGRSVARSNLVKCAVHGNDPNWGRILASVGTTNAAFDPTRVDIAINEVWVCRNSRESEDREKVDMSGEKVNIQINLNAGDLSASILTTDLTAQYVHENSVYSS